MKLITIILAIVLIILIGVSLFLSKKILKEKKEYVSYQNNNKTLNDENNKLKSDQEFLLNKNKVLSTKEQELQEQIEKILKNQDILTVNFENSKKSLNETYFQYETLKKKQIANSIKEYNNEYLETLKDFAQSFEIESNEKQQAIAKLRYELTDLQKTVKAAVEANIRLLQDKEQENFYKLQIPKEDLEEVSKLREVGKILRNPEPLNKVIWKVYYEKPTTALLGRVVGAEKKTGIYKLTNLENGMTYVGQAISIADRFRQHIKRGLGAENATNNKLYPAMKEYGVENFSFEIIEECLPEELNDKEQKWQDYFLSKTFGYSIK